VCFRGLSLVFPFFSSPLVCVRLSSSCCLVCFGKTRSLSAQYGGCGIVLPVVRMMPGWMAIVIGVDLPWDGSEDYLMCRAHSLMESLASRQNDRVKPEH